MYVNENFAFPHRETNKYYFSMEGTVDINNGEAFKQILQNKINPDG